MKVGICWVFIRGISLRSKKRRLLLIVRIKVSAWTVILSLIILHNKWYFMSGEKVVALLYGKMVNWANYRWRQPVPRKAEPIRCGIPMDDISCFLPISPVSLFLVKVKRRWKCMIFSLTWFYMTCRPRRYWRINALWTKRIGRHFLPGRQMGNRSIIVALYLRICQ